MYGLKTSNRPRVALNGWKCQRVRNLNFYSWYSVSMLAVIRGWSIIISSAHKSQEPSCSRPLLMGISHKGRKQLGILAFWAEFDNAKAIPIEVRCYGLIALFWDLDRSRSRVINSKLIQKSRRSRLIWPKSNDLTVPYSWTQLKNRVNWLTLCRRWADKCC